MATRPLFDRAGSAISTGFRDLKIPLALVALALFCIPRLLAVQEFWNPDGQAARIAMLRTQLYLFDATMMILMAAITTRRLTLPVFAIAFVLAGIPPVQWLIDVKLNGVLQKIEFLHWFFRTNTGDQLTNARAAKTVLFTALLPVLVGQVLFARTRTIDRAFALMGTAAILITTFLFHTAIFGGTMQLAKAQARDIIRYAVTAGPEETAAFCGHIDARCISVTGRERLEHELRSAGAHTLANELVKIPDESVVATTTGTLVTKNGRPTLRLMLIGFRVPTEGETVTLAIDEHRVGEIQLAHERSFALLAIAAHGFWTLFMAVLCALHHWRGRARIFKATETR